MESSCQKFGLDLLRSITLKESDKNVIYSPMSIYFALGMTLCGAKNETLYEMLKVLSFNEKDPNAYHSEISKLMIEFNKGKTETGLIKIANKLFLEKSYSLLDTFKDTIKKNYDGGVDLMDFQTKSEQSRLTINSWVEKQTNDKIKNLLASDAVSNMTKLVLINAIYFKGSWQNKFNVLGKKDFHLLDKSKKSVEMIGQTETYPYLENSSLGFRAVQIPFTRIENNRYSMMIVLPNEKYSLPTIEKSILDKNWHSIFGPDLFKQTSVNIIMPKFRIESSFKLKEVLQRLGMVKPFSSGADFSAMTGGKDLFIDNVIHKAFIDVNEHGVEAAATTAVKMLLGCAMGVCTDPIEFNCDHPFIFALLLEGSNPLFFGLLLDC